MVIVSCVLSMKISIGKKTGVATKDILLDNNLIALSPNPSNDKININVLTDKTLTSFEIFDIQGKQIQVFNTPNATQIDVQQYPKGSYILKCNFGNEYIIKKFEVE